ncbi:hypothetical protein ACLB2K_020344 [Fragaria x ananassa]
MEERRRLGCSGSGGDNGNHNVSGKEAGMLMLWWVRVVGFLSLIWAGCWVTQFPQNNRAWSKAPCTIWAWRFLMGPFWALVLFCSYVSILAGFYFMFSIIPHPLSVWRCGLCPDLHILHTMSVLGGRRVTCFVKWSQLPSGRMRLSVTGIIFQWQHARKAISCEL